MKLMPYMITMLGMLVCSSQEATGQKIREARTTLDSLQGRWVSRLDPLNVVVIKGRQYLERYNDKDIKHEDFYIYFSDTIVKSMQVFDELKLDTNKLSGQFLITRSIKNRTEWWCYDIWGFDYLKSGITVAIADTWAKYRPTVFKLSNLRRRPPKKSN